MGVFTFVCRSTGGEWSAKQLSGDLEATGVSTYELQRRLVQAALAVDSSGGINSSFSMVSPFSAVFQVVVYFAALLDSSTQLIQEFLNKVIVGGGGGGAFVGGSAPTAGAASASSGGAAAPEAPAAEAKKEEKEESDDDMGFSLFD